TLKNESKYQWWAVEKLVRSNLRGLSSTSQAHLYPIKKDTPKRKIQGVKEWVMFFLFFLEYLIHFIQHKTLEIAKIENYPSSVLTFMLWLRKIEKWKEDIKNVKQQATLFFLGILDKE
ncbi:hypothetical protein ACJX0J_024080, partial [Zea mays]